MPREMRLERDVKDAVKKMLTEHGWFWWMPPSNAFGRTGIADINAVKDGLFLAIETKLGTRKPTPMQLRFLKDVREHGGYGFVVNEERLGVLGSWLRAFDINDNLSALRVADILTPET
jgi:hypothetical protein